MEITSSRCFFALKVRVVIFFLSDELTGGAGVAEVEMVPSFLGRGHGKKIDAKQRYATIGLGP
jgi:hypothetical protein